MATKLIARFLALAAAVGMLFPSLSEAGRSLNHNQTRFRG